MIWQIFSLYPQIFENFLSTSLIARAIDKKILKFQIINWRDFGSGNYKQVDDRPYGGGSGMVLQIEPIVKALVKYNSLSELGREKLENLDNENLEKKQNSKNSNNSPLASTLSKSRICPTIYPNNSQFYTWIQNSENQKINLKNWDPKATLENGFDGCLENLESGKATNLGKTGQKIHDFIEENEQKITIQKTIKNQTLEKKDLVQNSNIKKATILLTPRGFPLNQKICQWLSEFDQLSLICGRFEGFDYRLNELVDLEISIGDFVTNGGEIPAMCLIEAVSRLVPDFITKSTSHLHDSFSPQNNDYLEQKEFVIGKKKLEEFDLDYQNLENIRNQILREIGK